MGSEKLQVEADVELYSVTSSPSYLMFPVEVTSENNSDENPFPIAEDVYCDRVARHRTWSSRRHMGGTRSPHGMSLQCLHGDKKPQARSKCGEVAVDTSLITPVILPA